MGVLNDKVIVLVGGGRGVGRAVALGCAAEGARVVVNDLGAETDGTGHDPDVAVATARAVEAAGGQAISSDADASSRQGLTELLDQARSRFGRVDGGAYFAASQRARSLLRMSDEDLDAVLDTELKGAFRFLQIMGQALVEQKTGGALIVGTGPAGYFGLARHSNTAAAAGGVLGLVRSAAAELKKHSVRVNGLAPTARTRMTEKLPLFRSIRTDSLTAEHVAPVAIHLLSEAASDVHGEVFGVAGGRVYGFRVSETTGWYSEGPPASLEALQANWRTVTRS